MRQVHLRDIAEQGGVNLVFGADDDIDQGQRAPRHHAKSAHIVPLVGAEVDIKDDGRAGQARLLGGEEGGAAAGLQAQVGAGELEDAAVADRRRQRIVNRQVDVGAIIAVIDQRELVRRLNAQHDSRRAVLGFARDEACLHAFIVEEMQDEVADRVVADGGQQRRLQPQPFPAHADVGGRAADVRGEAVDVDEGRPDIVGIKVNGAAAHVQRVVGLGHVWFQPPLNLPHCSGGDLPALLTARYIIAAPLPTA